MPDRTVRVGDVVAWMDVPNGATVKSPLTGDTALRLNDCTHPKGMEVASHRWQYNDTDR